MFGNKSGGRPWRKRKLGDQKDASAPELITTGGADKAQDTMVTNEDIWSDDRPSSTTPPQAIETGSPQGRLGADASTKPKDIRAGAGVSIT